MMRIYIYPTYTPSRDKSGNQYIKYFHDAFEQSRDYTVLNRLWQVGISSLFFNLDADLFIIQWIDLIPYKRVGKLQFFLFLILMSFVHIFFEQKKIVWILHNKHAHRGESKIVDIGMKQMARWAHVVITHAGEGVDFFNKKFPEYEGKCHYIPHPVYTTDIYCSKDIKWDYIIWGSISPRKKVAEFLHFANQCYYFRNKRILVCGNCADKDYAKQISDETNDNIEFVNKFMTDEELKKYIQKSEIILFTYNSDSLLSSGALIYSLNFLKPIVGPNAGNFADLKGIVRCYNTFEDVSLILPWDNSLKTKDYIEQNSWKDFPEKISKFLQS